MPDATALDLSRAAGNKQQGVPGGNPDRVGEELADDAHIWRVYDRVAKEDDDRRVSNWNRGLDNLALFAGLFSAVTTAFIIESQKDLKPDYSQLTFLVLNATVSDRPFIPAPFVVPAGTRTTNSLWIASLVLSLSAALIAIMGKDWIGMYMSRPVCNPRQWAEMRTYRLRCVERWYMSGVIAAAPVLLHISLLLFGAGLVTFIAQDSLTHHLTLGLSLTAGLLYFVTALSAIIFPGSPFKSPATQMIRAAFLPFIFYLRDTFSRPKRDLLLSLQRAIDALIAPGLNVAGYQHDIDGTPVAAALPESAARPYPQLRRSALRRFLNGAAPAALAHQALSMFQKPRRKSLWKSLVSRYRSIHVSVNVSAGPWTDMSAYGRAALIADSLAWLNSASQSPDVFRALLFALGDLVIGKQVGRLVSRELATRIRTEIRHNWMKVDFLTLSRYVLADRNLVGDYVLNFQQFNARFDLAAHPSLRCEDGLAAFVRVGVPGMWPEMLQRHFTDHVTQPRMAEFLIPYMGRSHFSSVEAVILLANRHWTHFRRSFQLEVELYRRFDHRMRLAYDGTIVAYYGRPGSIEILSFLCYGRRLSAVTEKAALKLMLQILSTKQAPDHMCLAYLYTRRDLWRKGETVIPPGKICSALQPCLRRMLSSDSTERGPSSYEQRHEFKLAVALTVAQLLSPVYGLPGECSFAASDRGLLPSPDRLLVRALTIQLCHPQTVLLEREQLAVVRIILDELSLSPITTSPLFSIDDGALAGGIAVLAMIVRCVGRRLSDANTCTDGAHLLRQLVYAEAKGARGETVSWDLGKWIDTSAPEYVEKSMSIATAMQEVHDAMADELYPQCAASSELRALWERIGYTGRPDDVFSDPFLSVGAFLMMAEAHEPGPSV